MKTAGARRNLRIPNSSIKEAQEAVVLAPPVGRADRHRTQRGLRAVGPEEQLLGTLSSFHYAAVVEAEVSTRLREVQSSWSVASRLQ